VQFELAGGDGPLEVDRLEVSGAVQSNRQAAGSWSAVVSASEDGQSWSECGRTARRSVRVVISMRRLHSRTPRGHASTVWNWNPPRPYNGWLGEVALYDRGARVEVGGPYHFSSAWKSAGAGEEWVYVDLGPSATFDRIQLFWLRRASEGAIQISDDANVWQRSRP